MQKNPVWWLNMSYFSSLLILAAVFLWQGKYIQIANLTTLGLFYLGIIKLEGKKVVRLKLFTRVLLLLALLTHVFIGEYFEAYYTSIIFDKALHLAGSFAFALLGYDLLTSGLTIHASKPRCLALIITVTSGFSWGAFFELWEFALDYGLHEHNQLGLLDTNLDLTFDFLGSLVAGILAYVRELEIKPL